MTSKTSSVAGLLACGLLGAGLAAAQTQEYAIDGSNNPVTCRADGSAQTTGRRFGNLATVTGCTLAADSPYLLPGPGVSVYCKGGSRILFYPGSGRLRGCVVALDANLRDTTNAALSCKAGGWADFVENGYVAGCNRSTPGGPGGPGGGTGTTGGGTGGGVTLGGTGGTLLPPGGGGSHAAIIVPGETGRLAGGGQYTAIGPSSNRPGGRGGYLYLGDGRASATYLVQSPASGRYALWIRFDDDGKHASGARSVEVTVNGALALRWRNESRDTGGWVNLPVGMVDLRGGPNTIVFTKAATSSAAFVMDEFVLSDAPGFVPQ